ncbi:MAG TPA: hypothetical protein DEH78_31545 [Solibacterales bacterium]|nr:hypothetical protein [Bryobacterales bacterium]
MSRTVSATTQGKLNANAWEPGYLVDMKVSTPLRFSTRGLITWNGIPFVPAVLTVSGLIDDSSAGTLQFKDPTLAIQTLARTTSLVGRRVAVARFYEGALGTTDPIWFFEGVIASARELAPPQLDIALSRVSIARGLTPPRRINRSSGFNVLAPEGKVIRFRGSDFRLERARG